MSYAQLDVHFDEHIKFDGLSLAHFGLMACAFAYCNRNLTDGMVPRSRLSVWGVGDEAHQLVGELLRRKIWLEVDGGYSVVGFLEHNYSASEVKRQRDAKKKRQADFRAKANEKRRVARASHVTRDTRVVATVTDTVTVTDLKSGSGESTRGVALHESPEVIAQCQIAGVRLPTAADVVSMRAHYAANGRTPMDWHAALVRWQCTAKALEAPRTTAGPSQNENAPESIYGAAIAMGRKAPYSCPPGTEALLRTTFRDQGYHSDGRRVAPERFAEWLAVEARTFAEWLSDRINREPKAAIWYSNYDPKGFQKRLNEIGAQEAVDRERAPILGEAS